MDNLVLKGCDRERALPAVRFRNVNAPGRQCPIRSSLDAIMQALDVAREVCLVVLPRQPIYAGSGVLVEFGERLYEQIDADVVEERGEPLLPPFPGHFPYAFQRL